MTTSRPTWRTSSFTDNGTCVALADLGDDTIGLRNTNDPSGLTLHLTRSQMGALIDGVKAGDYDDLTN